LCLVCFWCVFSVWLVRVLFFGVCFVRMRLRMRMRMRDEGEGECKGEGEGEGEGHCRVIAMSFKCYSRVIAV